MSASEFPIVRVFAWDVAEIASPVGLRHIPGGAPAFKYMVASGCSTADAASPGSTSGTLIFEGTKFDLTDNTNLASHLESKVMALTINVANSGAAVSDMKLYLVDDSALRGSMDEGLDPGIVQISTSQSWTQNITLPSGTATQLTSTIPSLPNVLRADGTAGLVAQDDQNSSEFIYLNLVLPLGSPFGTYGICGSGDLRFGLIFNYWSNSFLLDV